ncbi:GumC family protein [Rivularia sp. UHCC 0363]|uniref:GumC family protein n=1 Tax=Rivularia sp. UHCC 0363 TaxID=3110244 RepID=UPI002B20CC93|nr:polysaccharide biosynthesis tyrosine autokinase [Rivularia sp. UHCC 0363]MEA5595379.1 polysaccharide biosynthesis tyrosine autokinase [Rivularia sp. UHCC 0363]
MENNNYPEEIDIQKYLLVLKRRWLVATIVFAGFAGFAAFNWITQKPASEATGKLLFRADNTSSLTGAGKDIGHLESIKREANPLDTQAIILQSEPIIKEVVKSLDLEEKNGQPLNPDSISISTGSIVGTDIMRVSYTSDNPELAIKVVNNVMEAYIKQNIDSNSSEAIAAGRFIERQLPGAEKELNNATRELRDFKQKNQVIELKEEKIKAVDIINEIDKELAEAKSDFAEISARENEVSRQVNLPLDKAIDITSLSQVKGVQEVLDELQKVQTELTTLRTTRTNAHPSIVDLEQKEAALNNLLQKRTIESLGYQARIAPSSLQIGQVKQNLTAEFVDLHSQRLGLAKKIESLSELRNIYKQRTENIPNLERMQNQLEQRLSIAQKSYENLKARLEETKLAENQTVGNASIVEKAREVHPSPQDQKKRFLISFGSLFVGLLLSIGSAYFADLIDRRLKTAKEAENLFGYTLLGLIPKFDINTGNISAVKNQIAGVSERVIVATSPRTVIHEAYQMLQANLKFISLDKKVRSIVVTSSVAGEGKTEVAANLAAVMAQVGRRVLLIDADLRQPSQHHLWGLINSIGLSNVMVGENNLEDAVQIVADNLSVLTSGVMPPNPLALIDSERMTSFIEMLSVNYDYIVFDTPPLVGTAETAVLSQMVDGVLVVVRPGLVDSASANAAKSLLERSEANVLGIIANGVNVKHEPNNYFYYSSPQSESSAEKVDAGIMRS